MVLGLKPMGKLNTPRKYKCWTEPRSCMVLGLKPMGKLITRKYKYWTEPRSCMVLGLKPYGETNYFKKKVLDRTNVLHGPRTQTYGETSH